MKIHTKKRLLDALTACKAIESFVAKYTFADYERNLMLRSAVERQFEIIGEALHQAEVEDPTVTDLLPELRRIVGMRNRIIHGYDSVDDELLWKTIQQNIPPLRKHLEQTLEAE
ncbi:MAG: HepT-like ribonuclease domain-containing protein [Chloroflexota bacterium]